ncbi:hypothetical protein KUS54_RS24510 [Escherichia coli]|uniref:hypothetical protein n=1 Tax=Escherichia coli TaxID=562 RepID=UPI00211D340F|nr:hypothetical protein [Escherichia coli]
MLFFKWHRLWQNEGSVSPRLPVTNSSDTGIELLPMEIKPDEQEEPMVALTPALSPPSKDEGIFMKDLMAMHLSIK